MRSWRLRDRILRPVNRMDRFARWQGQAMTDHFRDTMLALDQWEPGRAPNAVCAGQNIFLAGASISFSAPLSVNTANAVLDCRPTRHEDQEAPVASCTCGHYATSRLSKVPIPNVDDSELIVIGQVIMWGRLIEHNEGWRAQYAYPGRVYVFGQVYTDMIRSRYFAAPYGGEPVNHEQVEREAYELSVAYGICATAIDSRTLERMPQYGLETVGLVDSHGCLVDRRVPTRDEQIVRPWTHEPGREALPYCTRCGQNLGQESHWRHNCMGRYDHDRDIDSIFSRYYGEFPTTVRGRPLDPSILRDLNF